MPPRWRGRCSATPTRGSGRRRRSRSPAARRAEDRDRAERALVEISGDLRDETKSARLDVAAGIRQIEDPRFRRLLIPMLYDPSVTVADEAMESVQAAGTSDFIFVPTLVSLLRNRRLKGRGPRRARRLRRAGHRLARLLPARSGRGHLGPPPHSRDAGAAAVAEDRRRPRRRPRGARRLPPLQGRHRARTPAPRTAGPRRSRARPIETLAIAGGAPVLQLPVAARQPVRQGEAAVGLPAVAGAARTDRPPAQPDLQAPGPALPAGGHRRRPLHARARRLARPLERVRVSRQHPLGTAAQAGAAGARGHAARGAGPPRQRHRQDPAARRRRDAAAADQRRRPGHRLGGDRRRPREQAVEPRRRRRARPGPPRRARLVRLRSGVVGACRAADAGRTAAAAMARAAARGRARRPAAQAAAVRLGVGRRAVPHRRRREAAAARRRHGAAAGRIDPVESPHPARRPRHRDRPRCQPDDRRRARAARLRPGDGGTAGAGDASRPSGQP